MELHPTPGRIIVKKLDASNEQKTSSGIIVASEQKLSRHLEGIVVAVGGPVYTKIDSNDSFFKPSVVEKGDSIIFAYGEEYTIDGEKLYILNEQDVLAVKK